MNTIVLRRTYDPQDCTSVGWRYEWNSGRFMAERRSRWQGSLSGVRVLIRRRCTREEARASADTFTRDDEEGMMAVYKVTNKGYSVK